MPEYLAPGVYVEEISTGTKPIEGVSTSTAGFVGQTERGPTTPRLVTSWIEFQRWYGSYLEPQVSYLPFAVQGFFENGGKRVFIARVVGENAKDANLELPSKLGADKVPLGASLVVTAIGPGAWGNNLLVRVTNGTRTDDTRASTRGLFRFTVLYYRGGVPDHFVDPLDRSKRSDPNFREPDAVEDYDNLSAVPGSANYVLTVVNSASRLIQLDWAGKQPIPARPQDVSFSAAATALVDSTDDRQLELTARGEGTWGNDIVVNIEEITSSETKTKAVKITASFGDFSESFDNVTSDPQLTPDSLLKDRQQNSLTELLNRSSRLIKAAWKEKAPPTTATPKPKSADTAVDTGGTPPQPPAPPPQATATGPLPKAGKVSLAGATVNRLTSGPAEPEALAVTDFIGRGTVPVNERTGLAGLEAIDEISLLAVPDEVNDGLFADAAARNQITNAVLDQCQRLRDRFAVLSVERGKGQVQEIQVAGDTSYGAIYYPWIRVFDPLSQDTLLVPPAGHVVGIYARTDAERGVHKAPANEVVRGILTRDLNGDRGPLEYRISKGEHDILNPRGINVIRDFRSDRRGIRVWGARTMSSDGEWKYVNVRRLFIFVEESIDEGTQWVVFEPNDDTTWSRVRRSVESFLLRVWRDGALMGLTPDEAFFVKCDRTTMTQDDIDNGRLICYIGIAPVKPAEFVIFRISQKTADAPQ